MTGIASAALVLAPAWPVARHPLHFEVASPPDPALALGVVALAAAVAFALRPRAR